VLQPYIIHSLPISYLPEVIPFEPYCLKTGDVPCENSLLRQVSSLLRRLPAIESGKFQDDFLMVSVWFWKFHYSYDLSVFGLGTITFASSGKGALISLIFISVRLPCLVYLSFCAQNHIYHDMNYDGYNLLEFRKWNVYWDWYEESGLSQWGGNQLFVLVLCSFRLHRQALNIFSLSLALRLVWCVSVLVPIFSN